MNRKLEKTEADVIAAAKTLQRLAEQIDMIKQDVEMLIDDCAIVDVIRAISEKRCN